MLNNICTKYSKIENDYIGTYHNTMSPKINKPSGCKSCVHFTSRNCNGTFKDKGNDEHNFFG